MNNPPEIDEDERRRIVESGPVYLANGMRATLAGWKDPFNCGVTSALPGFYACSWETAQAAVARPDRRFLPSDRVWLERYGWLGITPRLRDFQTSEDYEAWQTRQAVAR